MKSRTRQFRECSRLERKRPGDPGIFFIHLPFGCPPPVQDPEHHVVSTAPFN
ncbi:MAG: hypothetical protein WC544_04810 [Patescibacteria group bacterium]